MPKFMLIVGGADLDTRSGNPDFRPVMLRRWMDWIRGLREGGRFAMSEKLQDRTGRRADLEDATSRVSVSDES